MVDTKPPTKPLPKLVMKEWPDIYIDKGVTYVNGVSEKALSDFTRVLEGVQKKAPLAKPESKHD